MTVQIGVIKDSNGQTIMDKEKSMRPQPNTENYGQLKKAESGRRDPPQGRVHQLIVQCQNSQP